MSTIINSITISVFGCEFYAPPEYREGYVFCLRSGHVYVSDKKPIRNLWDWGLQGIKFGKIGCLPHVLTEAEAAESLKPLKYYLVSGNICFTERGDAAIEEGRLYTWGTGALVYLRANKRVYLVEEHTSKLVDLGHFCEFPWLITYYSGFRYVSSWGDEEDE